ncbi:MAG: FliG C-terminal domain-containing protein [Hyphomonas sp.]
MSLPAPIPRRTETGLARAARLMRALGPESSGIWAELSPAEVRSLTIAMDELGDDAAAEADAARLFAEAARRFGDTAGSPAGGQQTHRDIWSALSGLPTDTLTGLVRTERAAIVALILSRLSEETSARVLRALPPSLAVETMQRLLHLGLPNPSALKCVEDYLTRRLPSLAGDVSRGGHERVARIFDRLDARAESVFLAALESAEPGAGQKVRSLMFTFDDLAGLDAAGMQTLLSSSERSSLTIALKGARDATAAAFFANMTQRAGELLREEIAGLGPLRRSEIEAARQEIVSLARQLIQRGEIRAGAARGAIEDELIE